MSDLADTIDLGRLRLLVEDALAHFYQQTYLQTHPLAGLIELSSADETRGQGLQRVLLGLIQDLRPSADVPYDSLAWRKYRYLYLRYVETLSPSETANDLGVSVRQARRYWHEGIEAIASVLWDRLRDSPANQSPRPPHDQPVEVGGDASPHADGYGDTSSDSLIEQEAARLGISGPESATSVADVVESVLDTIRPLALRRGRELVADVPSNLPVVAVERSVLRQVILGLLALDLDREDVATTTGTLSIRADADAETVRVCISSERAPSINSSTTINPDTAARDQRLAIARRLLVASGGFLELADEDPEATGIAVVLPTVRLKTILIVEDNPDAVSLFRRYLAGTSYRVVAAPSSRDAYDLAVAERPAVIMLDVMMPGQDGWEVLQLLKSRADTRDVPVIICSVLNEVDLAALLGAATCLAKPVSRQQLLDALGSVLGATGPVPPAEV